MSEARSSSIQSVIVMAAELAYTGFSEEELPDRAIWQPEPELKLDPIIPARQFKELPKIPSLKPSKFTSFAFRMPDESGNGYVPFSFKGRRHMHRLYNTPARRVLLFCGRQVEKTLHKDCAITLRDGSTCTLEEVEIGDRLVGLSKDKAHTAVGQVTWKSEEYTKPCVRIRTRQGFETVVALTHPMRTWGAWTEAGDLAVGDKLAVVRGAGEFTAGCSATDREVILAASMVAEGGTGSGSTCTFTQGAGALLDEFLGLIAALGDCQDEHYRAYEVRPDMWQLHFNLKSKLSTLVSSWGLKGHLSATKRVPEFVWQLNQEQTALFLNRLWAGDGHASLQGSSYHLEYDSISDGLCRDVQRLLHKFGVPTSFRRWKPTLYKGTDKWAYKLRVETQAGALRFLDEVGALGKTEDLPIVTVDERSNRDTFPRDIAEDIRRINRSRVGHRCGRGALQPSLRSAGLREVPKYAPTNSKLQKYIDFFRSDSRFDQELVERLAAHLDTELYWDEIVSIEDAGELPCYDITVSDTDSFVTDGLVTHNSTLLGNIALCYMSMVQSYKVLYVSPSATQTKTFSNDRIKEPIETSPVLKKFTTSMLSSNILEKQFINRSKITMRYAFLNADRCRGIPAWMLQLDEFQDIMSENIPVIEQCLSHAPERWKRFVYAGTPKSLDNNIEYYRERLSTQGEWVVPCERHLPAHWNVLGEKNIGRKSLVCEKCHKPIDPMGPRSQWANMVKEAPFESYRIPQLMVPWKPWDEIVLDYERYPRDKFYNEVLGISYDSGTRPLTTDQMRAVCNENVHMVDSDNYRQLSFSQPIFAGIDWGTGEHSYTVLVLATYIDMKFRVFYAHRFTGVETEPVRQLELICDLLNFFNVQVVGTDYGGGFDRNDHLIRKFGPTRIWKYQYLARTGLKVEWDTKLGRFKVHRTEVMSDIFNAIKRGKDCEFPRYEEWRDPYGQDFLNIFSEYSDSMRMIQYKHGVDKPNDTFHAFVTCWLASMLVQPRPDIILPRRENESGVMEEMYSGPTDQTG